MKEPVMKCPDCDGRGSMPWHDTDCLSCNATGQVTLVACLRIRADVERHGAACSFDLPISDFLDAAAISIDEAMGTYEATS